MKCLRQVSQYSVLKTAVMFDRVLFVCCFCSARCQRELYCDVRCQGSVSVMLAARSSVDVMLRVSREKGVLIKC